MATQDLDKSGFGYHRVRTYLGPSLGWVESQIEPYTVIANGGTYNVKSGDSYILVDASASVLIQLPNAADWVNQRAYQPATGFDRAITVKDLSGSAANFPIVIAPTGQQRIDHFAEAVVIDVPFSLKRFLPNIDLSGWVLDTPAVMGGGGGGGGDVFKAGNNTFTGVNTFVNDIIVPLRDVNDDSNNAASTAWVKDQAYIGAASLAPYAPLDSPAFVNTPTAPTPIGVTNNTTIATTAFVHGLIDALPVPAPINADYITSTANSILTNERVLTDSATISWDRTVPGQIKANSTAGGGNVSNVGTPTAGQVARWVTATTIEGVATTALGLQPLDGDLTAISALLGTNTIYYRSATDTWSPVTFSGLTFSGGILTVVAGGGDVFKAGVNQIFTGSNFFNPSTVVIGSNTAVSASALELHGTGASRNPIVDLSSWNASGRADLDFNKSRSGTIGVHTAVIDGDLLGTMLAQGSDGTNFSPGIQIAFNVDGAVATGQVPGRMSINTRPAGGGSVFQRLRINGNGRVVVGQGAGSAAPNGLLQVEGTTASDPVISVNLFADGASSSAPLLALRRSRGLINQQGAVGVSDVIGGIYFQGSDGTNFSNGASILGLVSAAVSAGHVQTALQFLTDNGTTFTERMRLFPSGALAVGPIADTSAGGILCNRVQINQIADASSQGLVIYNTATSANGVVWMNGGNLVLTTPALGRLLIQNMGATSVYANFGASGSFILGTNTNDSAPAGYIGEAVAGTSAGFVPLTNGVVSNLASILLPTGGDWIVVANPQGNGSTPAGATDGFRATISTSPSADAFGQLNVVAGLFASGAWTAGFIIRRFKIAAATTYYLNILPNFASGTAQATGDMFAWRLR